jgi:hypothetical protein
MRAIDSTIRFADEQPAPPDVEPVPKTTTITKHDAGTAVIVAGGTVAATQAHSAVEVIAILAAVAVICLGIYIWKRRSNP